MEVLASVSGALLSESVKMLIQKLDAHELLMYYRQAGEVMAELKMWEGMLRKIYAALDDAEEKQMTSRLVSIWLSELRGLAYDAEDVLDSFSTEQLRRKLKEEAASSSASFPSISLQTLKFNAEMMSKIQDVTARLRKINADKDDLNLKNTYGRSMMGHQPTERLPTTSLVNESRVYGRENDEHAILQLLKAEAADVSISVIPIIGMGGLGKTTLAQLVLSRAKSGFDFTAWVSVGEDFDVHRITKTILDSAGSEGKDLNSLQEQLKEKLSRKKFLIVLDDVWNENYEKWVLCRAPLESGSSGSKIVITTRNASVASIMGTDPPYHLKELAFNGCLSLFAEHGLGAKTFAAHSNLEEIGNKIVEKCRGLPLAVKVMGGLLRGKQDPRLWEEVLNSKIWEFPESNGILPALRVSYYHLPSHLKQCFAYCGILPKDFEIEEDELVLLWMAEGFLAQAKEKKYAKDLGHRYFRDLVSRSFFQQSTYTDIVSLSELVGELVNLQTLRLQGCRRLVKLPRSIGNLINLQLLDNQKTYNLQELPAEIAKLINLITLPRFVVGKGMGLGIVDLGKLVLLQGKLHIIGLCNVLNSQEVELANLKHKQGVEDLTLEWSSDFQCSRNATNEFKVLNLLMPHLKLKKFWIKSYAGIHFPTWVGDPKFADMVHLELLNCKQIESLPPLGQLPSLMMLTISGLDGVKEVGAEFYGRSSGNNSNLTGSFPALETLIIRDMSEWVEWSCFAAHFPKLLNLTIRNCPKLIGQLPNSLPCLQKLVIRGCQRLANLPGTLLSLSELDISECCPSLKSLVIRGITTIEDRSQMSYHLESLSLDGCSSLTIFPSGMFTESLKYLSIGNLTMQSLEELCHLALPHLTDLSIQDSPELEWFPDIALPLLRIIKRLRIRCCKNLRSLPNQLPELTSLLLLWVNSCGSLKSFPKGGFPSNLIVLRIEHCKSLGQPISEWGINRLTSLKRLTISGECPSTKLPTYFPDNEGSWLPTSLTFLLISEFSELKSISRGLGCLTSIEELMLMNCPKVRRLPKKGLPASLGSLKLNACPGLKKRCLEQKGEYWPLMQQIPCVEIDSIESSSYSCQEP
ncbi:Putative disease resistance protein RGA4 [Linum perenne]